MKSFLWYSVGAISGFTTGVVATMFAACLYEFYKMDKDKEGEREETEPAEE